MSWNPCLVARSRSRARSSAADLLVASARDVHDAARASSSPVQAGAVDREVVETDRREVARDLVGIVELQSDGRRALGEARDEHVQPVAGDDRGASVDRAQPRLLEGRGRATPATTRALRRRSPARADASARRRR